MPGSFLMRGGNTNQENMSAVWKYFSIDTPSSALATCNICCTKVPRGGVKPTSFNTTNLIKHLKVKHADEHKEFEATSTASKREPQQQTLVSSFRSKEQWGEKSQAAMQMSEKIAEMTVLCDLPLSFVDSAGFRLFMAHAVPKYVIPYPCT